MDVINDSILRSREGSKNAPIQLSQIESSSGYIMGAESADNVNPGSNHHPGLSVLVFSVPNIYPLSMAIQSDELEAE